MPRIGEILYHITHHDLTPVQVLNINGIPQKAPDGEAYEEVILRVKGEGDVQFEENGLAFLYVPFIAEIEALVSLRSGTTNPAKSPK